MAGTTSGRVLLCIPTLNPGMAAHRLLQSLSLQTVQPDDFVVVDSGSSDGSLSLFERAGARLIRVSRGSFSHGGTRQMVIDTSPPAEIAVFLTQDAVLSGPDSLATLVHCFDNAAIGAAYGRQLPREGAGPIEAHARLFNYPAESRLKTMGDAPALGIKTAFMSNSFGAYRCSALRAVGGFPSDIPMGEDCWVAARMLQSGWNVMYCAAASVFHSHDYGYVEEFRRYFDVGAFHARAGWLTASFGAAGSEGGRFVRSELAFLAQHAPASIPSALVRTVLRLLGYRAGRHERMFPCRVRRRMGMNRVFWGE
jgi:rhamnosyltransferase